MTVRDEIRILMADDQHLVRGALAVLLALEADFEVVAEVSRGDQVVGKALETGPTWRCSTSRCPAWTGWRPPRRCATRCRGCRVLVLTTFGRAGYLRRAMEAGVLGFLVKDAPVEQLADAVRRVARGERVVDPVLAASTLAGGTQPADRSASATPWWPAATGRRSPTSPRRLFLVEGTVRNYLSSAISKTGTRNRIEAVRIAEDNGWL